MQLLPFILGGGAGRCQVGWTRIGGLDAVEFRAWGAALALPTMVWYFGFRDALLGKEVQEHNHPRTSKREFPKMTQATPNQITLPALPPRPDDAHKGHFGLVLLVGGSRGMAGSISLAGMAALRGGAGLVRLAVPEPCLETVAGFEASYMTVPLPADADGRIQAEAYDELVAQSQAATVVALGPGLGRSSGLDRLVSQLYRELPCPMVIDADGLNALASQRDVLPHGGGPRILTPHPGEFARLVDVERLPVEHRVDAAVELASRCGVVVVLKGHRTCITDGKSAFLNETGNPGMATGGTGDVLTGLTAALVSQRLAPLDAARLAVHLHGLAGDLAAESVGQMAMIAGDLISFFTEAFCRLEGE